MLRTQMHGPVSMQTVRSRLENRQIGLRQGANRNQVRPRMAEQGPRLRGSNPGAECKRIGTIAFLCTPMRSHPRRGPAPRFGAHTWWGFATQHGVDSRPVFSRE